MRLTTSAAVIRYSEELESTSSKLYEDISKLYPTQKELFLKLIQEIIDGDPHELKDVCLINGVVQNQAEQLKEMVEDLFF